jgi:hypothetical protein
MTKEVLCPWCGSKVDEDDLFECEQCGDTICTYCEIDGMCESCYEDEMDSWDDEDEDY